MKKSTYSRCHIFLQLSLSMPQISCALLTQLQKLAADQTLNMGVVDWLSELAVSFQVLPVKQHVFSQEKSPLPKQGSSTGITFWCQVSWMLQSGHRVSFKPWRVIYSIQWPKYLYLQKWNKETAFSVTSIPQRQLGKSRLHFNTPLDKKDKDWPRTFKRTQCKLSVWGAYTFFTFHYYQHYIDYI